ncbi:MAG: hypothetical protein QNJ18_03880 [Xenococcaceae cyanobacterium MO_167.B52]|nr:hypothetical protein [Xenococcaceae cyanobacterium MO_167.B52]
MSLQKIGILRETKPYESRVPLVPQDLAEILQQSWAKSLEFLVQPSPTRAYADGDFAAVGALIEQDLSECQLIMGIKEVPVEWLIANKTYICFSHVIKGQKQNMPLLQALLQQHITLIDYEVITDAKGKRLVFFGRSAGHAGMVETLRAFGLRLKAQEKACIFQELKPIYDYRNLAAAKEQVRYLGQEIEQNPALLGMEEIPLVFAFTGLGNVGKGALEIFDLLPVQEIRPEELPMLFQRSEQARGGLYKVLFEQEDTLRNQQGRFDVQEYAAHPQNYHSIFVQYLPYISVLVNCVYWQPGQPRLLSVEDLQAAEASQKSCLQVVGDISCDPPDGSVGCTVKAVDLHHPLYTYYPIQGITSDSIEPSGITVLGVSNLPAGIPQDASEAFSQMLKPWVKDLLEADYRNPDLSKELPPALAKAVITHQGSLMKDYQELRHYLFERE